MKGFITIESDEFGRHHSVNANKLCVILFVCLFFLTYLIYIFDIGSGLPPEFGSIAGIITVYILLTKVDDIANFLGRVLDKIKPLN
ncbi:hypothetical protein ABKY54_004548 [Vibrio harveyi]